MSTFALTLKTLTGDVYEVEVEQSTTILQLKHEIHQQHGFSPDAQKIIFGSKLLKNEKKMLVDYNIIKPCMLRLAVRVRKIIMPEKLELVEHTNHVYCVCFSHDDTFIASSSADGSVKIWDLLTGECRNTLKNTETIAQCQVCAISLDDTKIVCGRINHNNNIDLWDVKTGECVQVLSGHGNGICGIAISNDYNMIVSACLGGKAKVWNTETGECLTTFEEHTSPLRCVCINSDDTQAFTAGYDGSPRQWDIRTGDLIHKYDFGGEVYAIAISKHDEFMLCCGGGANNPIKLWDVNTQICIKIFEGHRQLARYCVFGCNYKYIISSSYDGSVKIWDFETQKCLKTISKCIEEVYCVQLSHYNNAVLMCSGNSIALHNFLEIQDELTNLSSEN